MTRTKTEGGTQETRTQYEDPESYRAPQAKTRGKAPSARRRGGFIPGGGGGNPANSGVGMLMAEFFLTLAFLVLIFFTSKADVGTRIMHFVKRASLTCLLFFLLAIVSAMGPTASKVSKVFGALILVAIMMTTDLQTGIQDFDNLIKNEWAGTSNTPTTNPNQAPQSNAGTPGSDLTSLSAEALSKLAGVTIGSPAWNSITAELRAFKSGEIWKVPPDIVTSIADIGTHSVTSIGRIIRGIGHFLGL